MARSLDFYLGLGCEVRQAADGWALLRCDSCSFVLIQVSPPSHGEEPSGRDTPNERAPWVRLGTRDVRALRRRLLQAGVPTSVPRRPDHAPAAEIVVIDPDQRPVVIEQTQPAVMPDHAPAHAPLAHLRSNQRSRLTRVSPSPAGGGPLQRKDASRWVMARR